MRFNSQPSATGSGFTKLASFVIVAGVLYVAEEVFVPIALASLLSFLLAPLAVRLGRWGLGKVASVLVVVTLAFAVIAVVGWLVTVQVINLADQLPQYRDNLRAKITALKKPDPDGVLSKASGVVKELEQEINSTAPEEEAALPTGQRPQEPVPVEVRSPKQTPLRIIASMAGPILQPLATAGAVAFFVILMLLQREDLRERFLKLVSGGELNVATQAVDDATSRVSRYLLMQLVVNATYGIPIGIGLYFIGVPNAFLWGLLATLLRFIPFVGPWIAAAFPIGLAIAVDPGWTKPLLTIGLFLALELISNNIVEPLLYGASTGVSNIALLMAAIFWTWLWGPVGLLLSTPLTVCMLVLGKYVPGLRFLSVLLGSEPVLAPEARFYQRMLAMDEDELWDISEKYIAERSLPELYDNVVLPALAFAEQDRHKGTLAEVRQAFIVQNTRGLIEGLAERAPSTGNGASAESAELPPPGPGTSATPVLCVPARDEADELAALMLVQLLTRKGMAARAVSVKSPAAEAISEIREHNITAVCISSVPPFAVTPARQICKRIKQEFPNAKVVIGIWNAPSGGTQVAGRLGSSCPDAVVSRLAEAVSRLEAILQAPQAEEQRAADDRAESPAAEVAAPQVLEFEPEEIFASFTRQAAKVLNVPVSLVCLIESDGEFWKVHGGIPPDFASGESLRETSVFTVGIQAGELLAVEDITQDDRFGTDPVLRERGIQFFAAVPLRARSGQVVGALCVTDTKPHEVPDRARTILRRLADRLISQVEERRLALA